MRRRLRALTGILALLAALLTYPAPSSLAQDVVWTRQFGTTAGDQALGVAVDGAGNVYEVGEAGGALPGQTSAGAADAYVRKYDPGGAELWTRQFGATGGDRAWGVAAAPPGDVYAAGSTGGALPGQIALGGGDAFVARMGPRVPGGLPRTGGDAAPVGAAAPITAAGVGLALAGLAGLAGLARRRDLRRAQDERRDQ